jgi:cephalosporin-C deacetylase-like acetyl esterase
MSAMNSGRKSHQFAEINIQNVKDLRRCIDYLETRPDIDSQKIAFELMSGGLDLGLIIPAVEPRIKVIVLISCALFGSTRPEVDDFNFVGRVKVPTLMLNGRYDTINPLATQIQPMADLLGTPAKDKKLVLYETDHIPPVNEMIKETLAWLDHYLGPVK